MPTSSSRLSAKIAKIAILHDEVLRVRRDQRRQRGEQHEHRRRHEPAAGLAPGDVGQRADLGGDAVASSGSPQWPRFISPSGRQIRTIAISR